MTDNANETTYQFTTGAKNIEAQRWTCSRNALRVALADTTAAVTITTRCSNG